MARPTWTWLRQVPDAEVVAVTQPGEHAGVEADALRARGEAERVAATAWLEER